MKKDQAEAIIRSVTGVRPDHPKFLDIAWEVGNNLIASCQTLDPATYGNEFGDDGAS